MTPLPDLRHLFHGRFTPTGLLGRGSFGEVWRVVDQHGQGWALKLIAVPDAEKLRLRELTEVHLLKGLAHRHVLQPVASAGTADGKLAIVMELADGGTLADKLELATARGELLHPQSLLDWLEQAAHALDYLHYHDVIHRDVKPANLLLSGGRVKVGDFGLARGQEESLATQSKMAGSPAYMAPEVWRQKGGPASDQYSLALTYVHLRQGFPAVQGHSWLDWIQAHEGGRCQFSPTVTAAERKVLRRALAAAPTNRFPTCAAFVEALKKAVGTAAPVPVARGPKPVPPARSTLQSLDGWKTGSRSGSSSGWRNQRPPAPRPRWLIPAVVTAALLLMLGGVTAAAVAFTPKRPGPTEVARSSATEAGTPTEPEVVRSTSPVTPATQPIVSPSTTPTPPPQPEPEKPVIPQPMPPPPPPDPIATGDAPEKTEVKPPPGVVVTVAKRPATPVEEGDAPPPLGAKLTPPNGDELMVKPAPAKWDLDLLARPNWADKKAGVVGTLKGVCGKDLNAVWGATFVGDGRGLVCVTRGIDADDLKTNPKVNAAVTPATIQLWDVAAERRVHSTRFSLDKC
jgi:serine/threonine protein kinase